MPGLLEDIRPTIDDVVVDDILRRRLQVVQSEEALAGAVYERYGNLISDVYAWLAKEWPENPRRNPKLAEDLTDAVMGLRAATMASVYQMIRAAFIRTALDEDAFQQILYKSTLAEAVGYDALADKARELGIYSPMSARTASAYVGRKAHWDGKTIKTRFTDLTADARQKISKSLERSLVKGEDMRRTARRLTPTLQGDRRRAEMIARTELQRVSNDVQRDALDKNKKNLEGVQCIATLDKRACLVCAHFDHAVFYYDGKPPVSEMPNYPIHPNCRCTYVPIAKGRKGLKLPTGQRATSGGPVPATTDFEAWLRSIHLKGDTETVRQVLGAKRYVRWLDGTPVSRFVTRVVTHRAGVVTPLPKPKLKPKPKPKPKPELAPKPKAEPKPKKVPGDEKLGKFETRAEAEAWANKKFSTHFDFDGCHLDNINPTLEQWVVLQRDFPEVAARVKYVGTFRNVPRKLRHVCQYGGFTNNAYANAHPMGRIGLNPTHYGNKRLGTLVRFEGGRVPGSWSVPVPDDAAGVKSVLSHEFGHQVHYWLKFDNGSHLRQPFFLKHGLLGDTWFGEANHTYDMMRDAMRATYSRGQIKRQVSGYAQSLYEGATFDRECWSELLAAHYHTPPSVKSEMMKKADVFFDAIKGGKRSLKAAARVKPGTKAAEKLKDFLHDIGVNDYDSMF